MLALKKKREAEAKAAAEAAAGAASTNPSSAPSSAGESTSSAVDNKVSLLGIGGKKKTKENGGGGKKRTPGEIRIQKGEFCDRSLFSNCVRYIIGLSRGDGDQICSLFARHCLIFLWKGGAFFDIILLPKEEMLNVPLSSHLVLH